RAIYRDRLKKLDQRERALKFEHEHGAVSDDEWTERWGKINLEREAARKNLAKVPTIDVPSAKAQLTGLVAEWDRAAIAGDPLVGRRRNELGRQVLQGVTVDRDESNGMMIVVTPTTAWAGLFAMLLVPSAKHDPIILA